MSEGETQSDVIQPQNRVVKYLNSPRPHFVIYVRYGGHLLIYRFTNGQVLKAVSCVNRDIASKLLPFAVGKVVTRMIASLART